MDNIVKLINEYSKIVSSEETEQAKCSILSKSKLVGEYADCWLLLAILLNDKYKLSNVPSFYNIRLKKNFDKREQLLKIKFLLFLEIIYQNKYKFPDVTKMNPIEFIRRSDYEGFFKSYEEKFGWKAETLRAIFDSNPKSKPYSLKHFIEYSNILIKRDDVKQSEKDMYKALTGDVSKIINSFETVKDEHDEMWAKLFSSYVKEEVPKNIAVDMVKRFTPIEFLKYCYRKDLQTKLKTEQIICSDIKEIDEEALAFYFNLAIIFDNNNLKSFLLPTYLSLLYKCGQYDCFFNYFPKSTENDSTDNIFLDYVPLVASLNEPDESFLQKLRERQGDLGIRDILIKIKDIILQKDANSYMKALKWLGSDDSTLDDYHQLATSITYNLVFKDKLYEAYETFQKIKEDMVNNEYNEEVSFWEAFLPKKEDNVDEKAINSFKYLLFWITSLKYENEEEEEAESVYKFYPYGYRDFDDNEKQIKKANELFNYLIYYITSKYKKKLNEDVDNEKQI